MGWTRGFEPPTTGITKRTFVFCTLKNQALAIRKDVQRRVRDKHSNTKLSTVEMVPTLRLQFWVAHESYGSPKLASEGGTDDLLPLPDFARGRRGGVITILLWAAVAPDNAHLQSARGHPMPATRSAPKGPPQGAG